MRMNRREWLKSASALTLATIADMALGTTADAFFHGSAAFPFNGGKSQIQSSFLEIGGDFPFINVIKNSQDWTLVDNSGHPLPSTLDTNGYPTSISNGGVYTVFFIPTQTERPGNWILSYTSTSAGTTTITMNGLTTFTNSGVGNFSTTILAATMVGVGSEPMLQINTTGITNVAFYHSADAAAFAAGEVFGTRFKQLLQQGRPGVIRFLNWQIGNNSNVTTWATRKPTTYYSYAANDVKRATNVVTGGATDAYTATTDGTSAPADKQTLILTFDHTASSGTTWTLNLNGTGAVPLVDFDGSTVQPQSGGFCSAVYEASLNTWYKTGGSNANPSGIQSGMPPELCFQLCKEIGAHPYFVTPPLTIDPITDYMSGIAAYCIANNPGWMIPRFEGINESWNGNTGAGKYCGNKAIAYWGYTDFGQVDQHWQGLAISNLGQSIATAYAVSQGSVHSQTNYQVLNGIQSGTFATASNSNPRMNCVRAPGFLTVTFTNGSANIVATGNTLALNAPVQFGSGGGSTTPANIVGDTTYYVKTTGSTITISATPGGAAIVASSSATGTNNFIYNATRSPAYNWVTTVCCTNYVNYSEQDTVTEISDGYKYLQAVANADTATQASLAASYEATNDVGLWAPAGGSTGLASTYDTWFAWANSFGVTVKLCAYEGGSSPDYFQNVQNCFFLTPASSITTANPCVVTLPATVTLPNGSTPSGNPCAVGMPVSFGSLTDMTQINCQSAGVTVNAGSPGTISWTAHGLSANDGVTFIIKNGPPMTSTSGIFPGIVYYVKTVIDANTFSVSLTKGGTAVNLSAEASPIAASKCFKVTAITSGTITLELDSSAFTAHTNTSGFCAVSANFPNSAGGGGAMYANEIRWGQKFAPGQQSSLVQNYQNMYSAGGEFPSCFTLSDASVWGVWDPDIYGSPIGTASTPPQWLGIVQFNNS